MSEPKPKPFFNVPFPDPPTLYNDQPAPVREAWVGWAKANPVGYLDYKKILRPTDDAYLFILQNDMSQNGGATSLTYPPEHTTNLQNALHKTFSTATISDILTLCTAREITRDRFWLIWATAPAATPADIDAKANAFIGCLSAPAGTPTQSWLTNLGAGYVSAFGTLAAEINNFVVLWAFEVCNGSLTYAGAWTVQIKDLSPFATQAYWPLAELTGQRRSIAAPLGLTQHGTVTQAAGPITNAASFPGTTADYLQSDPTDQLEPTATGHTSAAWLYITDKTVNRQALYYGYAASLNSPQWHVQYNVTLDRMIAGVGDNNANASAAGAGAGSMTLNTWHHVVQTWDAATDHHKTYFDGSAVQDLTGITLAPSANDALTVGRDPNVIAPWKGRIAEIAIWGRPLTAAEITALYNSGAGHRYPY